MSEPNAPWTTTTPESRLTSGPDKAPARDMLPPGTRLLDEFEILRVLGSGGFGIVYLARDDVLQRDVAIKEYFPAVLARRGNGSLVTMRESSQGCVDTFAKGLESFLAEARLLASFDHPALVKVHRFWRDNGTAYMAMPVYPGQTLKDLRLQMAAPPDEAWLEALITPLLGALDLLHGQGVLHRDIAPDNILLLPDGRPVLLDFGCARRAVASGSRWFTAHLKPQFAPLEQYADDGSLEQGPWTDLYSLGATLYFAITGLAPVPSVARVVRDTLPALGTASSSSSFPALSETLLHTIDWTLALSLHDRPKDVATVRRALMGEIAPPAPSPRFTLAASRAAEGRQPTGPSPGGELQQAASGPPPLPPRHNIGRQAALLLAFAGILMVGYGVFAVRDRAVSSGGTPSEAVGLPKAIVARAQSSATVQTAAGRPVTASVLSPATAPVTSSDTARVVQPSALTGQDRDHELTGLVERPGMLAGVAAASKIDTPFRAHKRSTRGPVRPTVATKRGSCGADSGMVTTALCILDPCRTKGRTSASCADRRAAEAARLRRMAEAG